MVGARRNYDVAKIIFEENMLDRLFVDIYFDKELSPLIYKLAGQRFLNKFKKYNAGLDAELIKADLAGALALRFLLKYSSKTNAYKLTNKRLANRLINYASKKTPRSFYGYDTSSLEFFEWANGKGWKLFLEQCVAPRNAQINMFKLFEEKYGINYKAQIEHCLFQQQREHKEWQYADKVLVPSAYVKKAMLSEGNISENKLHEINFGFTNKEDKKIIIQNLETKFSADKKEDKVIRILFAGNGGYRKGIADILDLTKRFQKEKVQFIIAGQMEKEAMVLLSKYHQANITYLGKLSGDTLKEQYKTADIFFFPSYLEGSAMVILEAMSWGLPIVTTHESGSVVENEISGFVSNAGDQEQLFINLSQLIFKRELRCKMSEESLKRSEDFSEENYGKNLIKIIA
jgi:glycosyltransferase involved in cell wall biosynthesis